MLPPTAPPTMPPTASPTMAPTMPPTAPPTMPPTAPPTTSTPTDSPTFPPNDSTLTVTDIRSYSPSQLYQLLISLNFPENIASVVLRNNVKGSDFLSWSATTLKKFGWSNEQIDMLRRVFIDAHIDSSVLRIQCGHYNNCSDCQSHNCVFCNSHGVGKCVVSRSICRFDGGVTVSQC
eukprot:TRINITY_DN1394_c0_g2_i7.p1 TRINITY_DN1394_c0_g2~~TRINITY_DN1394_c0_g2_i7.p1  ORF type:complete len:177 (-),score=42.62 TRINITY_DN1394_c0_g2_i7:55-585(-)